MPMRCQKDKNDAEKQHSINTPQRPIHKGFQPIYKIREKTLTVPEKELAQALQ
jgi:hypothetical protein